MLLRSETLIVALVFIIPAAISQARADEKYPAIWRKTMTSDPSINYALKKYSERMADKAEEAGRVLTLIRLLKAGCEGAAVSDVTLSVLMKDSGIAKLSGSKLKEVSDAVSAKFDGFDYEALAHLCSGVDYLFGRKGVLGHGLMLAGTGEPSSPYDPANPYLRVPSLQP